MKHLDMDYVESLIRRLQTIPENAKPKWGKLNKEQLINHLIWIVRHSMGRSKSVPFVGNWFTTRLFRPLMIRGWLPIPKNVKMPATMFRATQQEQGDIESFHALLLDYLNLVQADEFVPAPHPLFGDLGVDGWEQIHIRHFEHHLKQFGV